SSAVLALANVSASGPCEAKVLCRLAPPGENPSALASSTPRTKPMNSDMMLRWYQGGRKVSSPTSQRGGKMTKSTLASPASSLGEVSTVKMDGSGWSKLIVPIAMKFAVSYLYGA